MTAPVSKRLADRLAVAERMTKRLRRRELTFEDWLATAAYQATALVAVHGIESGTPMQRLYAAICAGNLAADGSSPYRACLWERFFAACLQVAQANAQGRPAQWATLGNALGGRLTGDLADLYAWFLDNLAQACPEIIGPAKHPSERLKTYRVDGGQLFAGAEQVETAHLAAFGLEACP